MAPRIPSDRKSVFFSDFLDFSWEILFFRPMDDSSKECDVETGDMSVPLLGGREADATLQNLDLEVAAGELLVLVGQESSFA